MLVLLGALFDSFTGLSRPSVQREVVVRAKPANRLADNVDPGRIAYSTFRAQNPVNGFQNLKPNHDTYCRP